MSSPFEAARAAARKISLGDDKDPQGEEEREAKKPKRSPLFSSPMTRDSPWKALRLTPSKRSSEESQDNESAGPARKFAALANRTHRKVFSTRVYVAKKLKRFQKDSPSSPLRRKEGFPRTNSSDVSVVDLCSSDEEESVIEQGKTPSNSPTEKPNLESKPPAVTPATTAVLPSKECTLKTIDDSLPKKGDSSENETTVAGAGITDSPTMTCDDNKTTPSEPQENSDCSLNGKRVSWKECAEQLQEQRSKMNNDKILSPMSQERKNSYHSFVMGTFSIERMRLLLDVLAPASLSAEAMKAESWMSQNFDHNAVSKVFSERFGNLCTKDLSQLAKGDFLVPEGMVSVKETLRAYRFSRERAMQSVYPKTPSEPTPTMEKEQTHKDNDQVEAPSMEVGEEAAGEKVQAANSNSFAWDGTFAVLPKDREEENPPSDDFIPSVPNEGFILPEEVAETKPTEESGAQEDEEEPKDDDDEFLDAVENHKEDELEEHLNHLESPQAQEESKEKEEAETPCDDDHSKERENESIALCDGEMISDNSNSNPNPSEPEGLKKSSDDSQLNSPTEGSIEYSTSTQENSFEGYHEAFDARKESEDTFESSIVEYNSNESNDDNQKLQLSSFQEVRTIISVVMKSIVDTVTKHCEKKEEQGTEEIEVDDPNDEPLKLDGPSGTECDDEQEEVEQNGKDSPLIVVSTKQLVLLALPLICLAVIVRRLGLFDVSNSIFEGCFRTFIQLHILGSLLSPIFKYGVKHPGIVGCYALFMILLASYEASSRTKYTYDGQFTIIAESLVVNVAWVATWAFGVILKPRPVWNPRYLLPIVGMLLGNSINAISITMDTITTSLVENQAEVDLYLSFGADQYEAVSNIVAHAIQKGATGSLNMMCVVGIVSIPGMMTGQILGGSSPLVAARYQAMIIFLIALTTLSTILVSSCLTVMSAFCSHQILRPDRFVKNRKRGLARLILWAWGYVFGNGKDMASIGSNTISNGLLAEQGPDKAKTLSRGTRFEIRPLKRGSVVSDGDGINSLIQVSGLNRSFIFDDGSKDFNWVLFSDLSFLVNEGDLLLVNGPSGTGKSQLLRMMAGLSPLQEGDLWLQGRSWKDGYNGNNSVEWRRQVRYVTQSKVQIPGTPLQFIKKIQSFQSWKAADNARSKYDFWEHVSHHLRQWGMGLDSLKKEWAVLSGGESQRVLMAIALASRPKILLFDESTSALDHESKLAVETSIKDFVEDHEGGVMWVSHDVQQAERMAIQ